MDGEGKNVQITKLMITFILIISSRLLSGQDFILKSYTTTQGLSHNNIRAIVRDSTGFLWVGTWDGLGRFDGYEFRNYYHIPGDTSSIPFFSVAWLTVDRNNDLWLLTDWGQVVKYNRNTDNFSVIKKIDGISIEQVSFFDTDENGNLIIAGKNELIRWNDPTKKSLIYRLYEKDGEPFQITSLVRSISIINGSEIWLAGSKILQFIKTGEGIFTFRNEYPLEKKVRAKPQDYDVHEWFRFYNSGSGSKWIFSNTGLFRLDESSGVFRESQNILPEDEFTGRRFFWWGTYSDGFYVYDARNKVLSHIPEQVSRMTGAMLPDNDNSVWFTNNTVSGVYLGLNHLIFTPGYFVNQLIHDADSATPAVYSVIMDRNRDIWTGMRGYDHIVQFMHDGRINTTNKLTPDLMNRVLHIRSMIPVRDGIWIGYYTKMLQYFDYKSSRYTNYFPDVTSCRAITVNNEGNIYIGNFDLSLFYPSTGKTEVLWRSGGQEGIFKMYLDPEGVLWGGMAASKLLKYNTRTREADIISLPTNKCNVEDIIPGDNDDLWLALLGEGVCRYEIKTGTIKIYTTSQGLSNNTTYSLLKDQQGNIWVSTNNGISRINPGTGQIRMFGTTDGVKITEFNSGAKFITDDGEFIFGGMGGFVRFYPDSLLLPAGTEGGLKILITGLEISREGRQLIRPVNKVDTILLFKGEDDFYLTFSSTDFVNAEKIKFRYLLSGVNGDWMVTNYRNRNINYANVKPGWHKLQIEATDGNGNWVVSKAITVRVVPFYYQTKLFRVLVALLTVAIISAFVFIYVRQVKQRESQKQDYLKLQALRGQMNPHFIFNSLNSINYFISRNDRLSANRYISDFSRLIRSILTNLGNNFVAFENELSSIEDYLRIEHLRFGDKFDYKINYDKIRIIPGTEIFPGIIQPFVENAIWHGVRPLETRKGLISISFFPVDDTRIKCIIEDDGIGRMTSTEKIQNNSRTHKSQGINIVNERLEIIGKLSRTNYNIAISDMYAGRSETGTRVEVEIPVRTIKTKT